MRPLVVSERSIAPNRLVPPGTKPPNLDVPLSIAGFLLTGAMLASRQRRPALYASLMTAYLLFAGVVGSLLLALWTLVRLNRTYPGCCSESLHGWRSR